MATMETRINALATAIGNDVQDLYAQDGTLLSLTTTAKSSLVAAINEVDAEVGGITGSDFTHDNLTGVDANEHLDWTAAVGTIHASNYTDTTYVAGDFAHDSLANVDAKEHIDWTVDDPTDVIHANNYTNTVYTHPTNDGSKHVPATSTTNDGKVLTAGPTAGVFAWQTLNLSTLGGLTESEVDSRVQLVVDSAPAALDTLNELAAALGDDANFATNMTTALTGRVSYLSVQTPSLVEQQQACANIGVGDPDANFLGVYTTARDA